MTSQEIRKTFLDFFASKGHKIVPSAPLVNKDDPTLMFINAGMNPFKDFFLGNKMSKNKRISDTQKCLRVSGKQNDLEEVGRDSYHQTLFEMLGNWSFGDYFKEGAIDYAWELLTEVYKLPKDRLYVSIFEGDKEQGLDLDEEAKGYWKKYMSEDRILPFDKKDNFWEMGDTGPCGPCSEIHIDLRSDEEVAKVPGKDLVNMDHPQVIEIWNLVFIQFNRNADRSLSDLPDRHIDTGMGFERLCMAIQNKKSNYDTDVFTGLIQFVEKETGKEYTFSYADDAMVDIAIRIVVDHVRAVSFAISDGQMPGSTGAGYVIRRILRRAVRFYYSFLDMKSPFLHKMVALLSAQFKDVFPELAAQEKYVTDVIREEEKSFLRTLEKGLTRIDKLDLKGNTLDGETAFELYDTFGFPIDLTRLIAEEKGWSIDEKGFEKALGQQKKRSRKDAEKEVGDWVNVQAANGVDFMGFDHLTVENAKVLKYRTVLEKGKEQFQLVLDKTPFYPEGGGQIGDGGLMWFEEEKVVVITTKKENDLIIHYVKSLPSNIEAEVKAEVNKKKRKLTENNHTATHLLHAALREVLGDHVQQRGSLVKDDALRFDFSHFQKMTDEEIAKVEEMVNRQIRRNIPLVENRSIAINDAKEAGAMMLFGEKYGETVRMITFDADYSIELCGGCHVDSTGQIGLFKLKSESGVASGIRRIEAITADKAEAFYKQELATLNNIRSLFKNPKGVDKLVADLQEENNSLKKEIEGFVNQQANQLKEQLLTQIEAHNGYQLLIANIQLTDSKAIKNLAYQIKEQVGECVIVFGAVVNDKPQLLVLVEENLVKTKELHAGTMIRELAKDIKGGGGGQAFFATAGGKDASGIEVALGKVKDLL